MSLNSQQTKLTMIKVLTIHVERSPSQNTDDWMHTLYRERNISPWNHLRFLWLPNTDKGFNIQVKYFSAGSTTVALATVFQLPRASNSSWVVDSIEQVISNSKLAMRRDERCRCLSDDIHNHNTLPNPVASQSYAPLGRRKNVPRRKATNTKQSAHTTTSWTPT